VILVADGSNYLSHFFGTISHGNLKEITSRFLELVGEDEEDLANQ
jgi:hypothetical protein